MISMRNIFLICLCIALTSTSLSIAMNRTRINFETLLPSLSITIASALIVLIIFIQRKKLGYELFVKDVPVEKDQELMQFLRLNKIAPKNDHIIVESHGRLIGHAYARILNVVPLYDDLDKEKKLWYLSNFTRILTTLTFTWEIIPRMMPVSTEGFMNSINKQIEDLRMTLDLEGSVPDPTKEARLQRLEKLRKRLLEGEGVRDVGFLLHVMVEGKDEGEIPRELDSNIKTMTSTLEAGLGVRIERLRGYGMLEVIQCFFLPGGKSR